MNGHGAPCLSNTLLRQTPIDSVTRTLPTSMDSCRRSNSKQITTSKRITTSMIGKSCPICLSHVEIRDAAVVIPCLHTYCILCIRKWSNLKRRCPLCNADLDSWFYKFDVSLRRFQKEKLLPSGEGKRVNCTTLDDDVSRRHRTQLFRQRRVISRSREELRNVRSRVRPLPRQRSFGYKGREDPNIIAERVKRWRASIYEQQLQAVPLSRTLLVQKMEGYNGTREIILQKIQPWIHRELQAVLGDPDPTIIVHVATSIFIAKHEGFQEQVGNGEDFLAPLRPFLHEHTDIFWHELSCFAESSLAMETYDTLAEYKARD